MIRWCQQQKRERSTRASRRGRQVYRIVLRVHVAIHGDELLDEVEQAAIRRKVKRGLAILRRRTEGGRDKQRLWQ